MFKMIKEIIMFSILCGGMIGIGWFGNEFYKDWSNQRELDGLYLKNYNYLHAKDITYEMDELGDWVCVNVRGMSYERGLEVCQHEMGHEIFAEECEKNITKCLDIFS